MSERRKERTQKDPREMRKRDKTGWKEGYRQCGEATVSAGRSSGDEVMTVRRCDGKMVEEEEEEGRWGDGGENLRRFHAWRAVCGGTGQPDWAASLAVARKAGSCQPAYRRRALYGTRGRGRERERGRVKAGDISRGGQKGVARAREKSRGKSSDRPVSLHKKHALKERERERERERDALHEPKSRGRDRVMPRPFSTSVDRSVG